MIVAIDGPAAAGKSSVAGAVADALGFEYLDTGAMYRAIALAVLEAGAAREDKDAVARIAGSANIDFDRDRITLDGRDVSKRIREEDVTGVVSTISANPRVRKIMVERQRALAETRDVVMEGRDIGSVVAPNAEVKVFLTASLDERARRRCLQRGLPTDDETLATVKAAIAARDGADETREEAPLKQADDAVRIDSTDLDEEEVVKTVVALVDAKRRGDGSR